MTRALSQVNHQPGLKILVILNWKVNPSQYLLLLIWSKSRVKIVLICKVKLIKSKLNLIKSFKLDKMNKF